MDGVWLSMSMWRGKQQKTKQNKNVHTHLTPQTTAVSVQLHIPGDPHSVQLGKAATTTTTLLLMAVYGSTCFRDSRSQG